VCVCVCVCVSLTYLYSNLLTCACVCVCARACILNASPYTKLNAAQLLQLAHLSTLDVSLPTFLATTTFFAKLFHALFTTHSYISHSLQTLIPKPLYYTLLQLPLGDHAALDSFLRRQSKAPYARLEPAFSRAHGGGHFEVSTQVFVWMDGCIDVRIMVTPAEPTCRRSRHAGGAGIWNLLGTR
jgi:hypothetical protein